MSLIITTPPGCNSGANAAMLARHFGKRRVIDNWTPGTIVPTDAIAFTHQEGIPGAIPYERAVDCAMRAHSDALIKLAKAVAKSRAIDGKATAPTFQLEGDDCRDATDRQDVNAGQLDLPDVLRVAQLAGYRVGTPRQTKISRAPGFIEWHVEISNHQFAVTVAFFTRVEAST